MKRLYGIKDGAEFTDLSLSKGRYFLFPDTYWYSELMINLKKKKKKVKRIRKKRPSLMLLVFMLHSLLHSPTC